MEFDKSRVYTALNADELPIGSRCIFADTIDDLRRNVQADNANIFIHKLVKVNGEEYCERFVADNSTSYIYAYAYDKEGHPYPEFFKPFESSEEAMKAIKAHGGWIKYNVSESYSLVIEYGKGSIYTNGKCIYMQDLLDDYVFADDGSPCGKLVEEQAK